MIFAFLNLIVVLLVFFVSLLLLIYYLFAIYSSYKGAPFVPTQKRQIASILKEAHLKKGQIFLELGCGEGRVVREAVRRYQVKGIGTDINPLLLLLARIEARMARIKNIRFRKEDVYDTDLSHVDVVFLFLMPKMLEKLSPRLKKAVEEGTLVISHGFRLTQMAEYCIFILHDNDFSTFYYRKEN